MKKLNKLWHPDKGPLTIYSKGANEIIPTRFRRLITVVMPLFYICLALFGVTAVIFPTPTMSFLVGTFYAVIWAGIVALSGFVSLFALIFRLRSEIYTAIVLAVFLCIYPLYIAFIVFHDPNHIDTARFSVIFAVALYPIMPAWRAIDIVLEIRKARQRQLYAKYALGVASTNELPIQRSS